MAEKPSLYLETSVVSYLAARPSRDVIALAHQQLTLTWWERRFSDFDVHISEIVLEEARQGDPNAARLRLERLREIPVLPLTEEAENLARVYMRELRFPPAGLRDALRLALSSVFRIDYLLTWNCRHMHPARSSGS